MVKKEHLLSSLDVLPQRLAEAGFPAFRTKQVTEWVCKHRVYDPAEMKNIPMPLRNTIYELFAVNVPCRITEKLKSPDGTIKMLLELEDGECIEAVLIPAPGRMTLCLTTQVG